MGIVFFGGAKIGEWAHNTKDAGAEGTRHKAQGTRDKQESRNKSQG